MESAKFDLHLIDYAIVVAYFIGVVAHGIYVSRKQSGGSEDYFLAGRSLPWYLIGFSLFASNMSGSSFVGLMGGAYANGVVIFNYEWTAALVLILFAIFILPSYLRAKISTVPGFLEERYDVRSRRAFSLFTILGLPSRCWPWSQASTPFWAGFPRWLSLTRYRRSCSSSGPRPCSGSALMRSAAGRNCSPARPKI